MMRHPILHPLALGLAGFTGLMFVLRELPLVALGAVAWLGVVAFFGMRQAQAGAAEAGFSEQADADARILVRPLQKLHEELKQIAKENSDLAAVKVVGEEAVREAGLIVAHAQKLADLRRQIKKSLVGLSEAEVQLARMEARRASVDTVAEAESIDKAIAAYRAQTAQSGQLEESVKKIDGKIAEAQASLSEIKARLMVGAADARTRGGETQELGEVVERLKTLGASFTEAEALLQEQVR